jgi:hypothetical protein
MVAGLCLLTMKRSVVARKRFVLISHLPVSCVRGPLLKVVPVSKCKPSWRARQHVSRYLNGSKPRNETNIIAALLETESGVRIQESIHLRFAIDQLFMLTSVCSLALNRTMQQMSLVSHRESGKGIGNYEDKDFVDDANDVNDDDDESCSTAWTRKISNRVRDFVSPAKPVLLPFFEESSLFWPKSFHRETLLGRASPGLFNLSLIALLALYLTIADGVECTRRSSTR